MLATRRAAAATQQGWAHRRRHISSLRLCAAARLDLPPPPAAIATPAPTSSAFRRIAPFALLVGPQGPHLTRTAATGGAGSTGQQAPEQQQQRELQFRVHRIAGDGACMFRAIVQGAQIASRGKLMSLDSEAAAATNLRLAVVQELRKRRAEIEPFLPGIATDFEQYCRTMSHPMAWGGEPEMVMASHVVQRPITVYHITNGSLDPIVTYGQHLLDSVQPIHLLWSGAHYDLLVPAPSP